jgi:hypothetical protein
MVENLMRRSLEIGLFAALVLSSAMGCGGGKHEPAKAPETNPWADYKGTYAGGPDTRTPEPVKAKASSTDAKAMTGSVASESKTDEDAAAPAVPTKKAAGKKRPKAVAKKAPKG